MNLENQAIRREYVKHIGNEYESVIAAISPEKNAKTPKIDKKMGRKSEKFGIASGIATSVFLYSFSGAEKKETGLPRIRVALLRERIPPTIVGDARGKLEEVLWYFHSERKQYAFRNQPNLNRVIVDKEETISEQIIRKELKADLQKNADRAFEAILWPETSSNIPDNKNLKLAIFAPEFSCDSDKGKRFAAELFERAGIGFRVYKSTLFILAVERSIMPVVDFLFYS